MKMRILVLAATLALCCATVSAEKIARPGFDPIEAELIADLHGRLLKVGQTVYARVTVEFWPCRAYRRTHRTVRSTYWTSPFSSTCFVTSPGVLVRCCNAIWLRTR
jgi:hypothetical protein